MHAENELERAIYYLNNRHRLTAADVPRYIRALAIAKQHGIEPHHGIWYLPEDAKPQLSESN